jgi:exosortase F-associated protein
VAHLAADKFFQKGMTAKQVRWLIGIASLLALIVLYLFQRINLAALIGIDGKTAAFLFNKTFRFIWNDVFMIGVIYAFFGQKRFVYFALAVQIFGILFVLLPYFVLKLYFHASNGPLISFLHRLVLNPTLMILLIPAFWLQTRQERT